MTIYAAKPARYVFVKHDGTAAQLASKFTSAVNSIFMVEFAELVGQQGTVLVSSGAMETVRVPVDYWLGIDLNDRTRFVVVDDATLADRYEEATP